jgi:hypothetical protein
MGDDSTVIIIGQGNQVQQVLSRKKQTIDATAIWVRDILRVNNIAPENVIIDVVGLGGGVVDLLRSTKVPGWGYNVKSFSGGSSATRDGKQTEFENLRGQSYWMLREGAEGQLYSLDIDDEEFDLLSEELTGLRYRIDERRVYIEAKKDFKARLGRSPDRADGVTMFFSMDSVAEDYVSFFAR